MVNYLFVGGSGRSGTSFLAKKLSDLPSVVGINDVELKIFGELNGLPDLYTGMVTFYSLERARHSVRAFRSLFMRLFGDFYTGQVQLTRNIELETAEQCVDEYLSSLTSAKPDFPLEITHEFFCDCTRIFIQNLFLAIEAGEEYQYRLEKTPHNLLHTRFLNSVFANSKFIHVTRDPRLVVLSLLKMPWGPDNLSDCVEWYKSYHQSWIRERTRCALLGVKIFDLRIEDFHFQETKLVENLSVYLEIDSALDLENYDYKGLVDIEGKISSSELSFLHTSLSQEINDYGYHCNKVGEFA